MAKGDELKPLGTGLSPGELRKLQEDGRIKVEAAWTPNRMQAFGLQQTAFELFIGGGKYGGKSQLGIVWVVSGNPDKPNDPSNPNDVNRSYVYHSQFLGVVIRKNEKDLVDWVSKAKPIYKVFGGEFTKQPAEFNFPSGAKIALGHGESTDAWEKWQGQNVTRFLIEEAGQIPEYSIYEMMRSSCRSPYPEMRAQLMLTANPGGPGMPWLIDRFIEPKDKDGNLLIDPATGEPYKARTLIKEEVIHPFTGKKEIITRMWIDSYIWDNPYAMADDGYILNLASMQDEKMRKAYLFGDWKSLQGTYFSNFSKTIHVIPTSTVNYPLQWWKKSASLDWGLVHEAAAYGAAKNPETNQIIVYKEFVTSGLDPIEFGAELARRWEQELVSQGRVVFYVSHDAMADRYRLDGMTVVELLARGVGRIIGKDSVYIPELIVKKLKENSLKDGRIWSEEIERDVLARVGAGIVFMRAPRITPVSAMLARGMMRTTPLVERVEVPDWEVARRIAFEDGAEKYFSYLKFFSSKQEVLPQLLILDCCSRLIQAIPKCIHSEKQPDGIDDKHFLGKDSVDSFLYLLSGMRDEVPTSEPPQITKLKLIESVKARGGAYNELLWLNRQLESETETSPGFNLPRSKRLNAR